MRAKTKPGCKPHTHVGGRIQAWAIPVLGDKAKVADRDPANAAGFRLRRARLELSGHIVKTVPYTLQVELADQVARSTGILDAAVSWLPLSEAVFTLGVHKVPFSVGQNVSSKYLQFHDRALAVQTMADFRELGLSIGGEALGGILGYQAGVYNGSNGQFTWGDDNPGLLYAGRLEAGYGDIGETEADLEGGGGRARVGGGGYYNDSATAVKWGYTADLRVKAFGVSVVVAYIQDSSEPAQQPDATTGQDAEVERRATYGQLGVALGRLPGLTGIRPLAPVELAFRLEMLDDNHALTDGGDVWLYTGALNYYFDEQRLKLQAAYVRKQEQHGPVVENDALVLSAMVRF